MGSSWVTLVDLSTLTQMVGFVLRISVMLIQFFLVFVRPFTARKGSNYYDWSISFASSLLSFQLILLSGILAENFGGPLNTTLEVLLTLSKKTFLDSFQSSFINSIDDEFEGAGYWKLIEAKYIANPLYENHIACFFLAIGLILCVCTGSAVNSASNTFSKNFRIGSSLAFMMPLLVSSVNCIYAVFYGGIYQLGSIIGLAASVGLIIYYLFFGFEIMGSHPKSGYYKSCYKFMNFDWPSWRAKEHIKNYEFLIYWLLTLVMIATAQVPRVTLPFAAFAFAVNLFCTGITPTHPFQIRIHKTIHRIKILKMLDSFFKVLFFGLLSCYVYWRKTTGTAGVKMFTVVSMILLYAIMLVNWVIFLIRVLSLCGEGHEGNKEVTAPSDEDKNGAYQELNPQNQTTQPQANKQHTNQNKQKGTMYPEN
jgi:hypothetical protein